MSLSKRNFPNLNRPLPRIESEVYNKIEEIDETNYNDGTPQTSSVSHPYHQTKSTCNPELEIEFTVLQT